MMRDSTIIKEIGYPKGGFKMQKQYTITKRIAKHGSQSIIIIPRLLEKDLKPGTVAQITIDVLEDIN